ncbi:pseudaminic acid synthase [Candidatus Pseudothioglobus singularis]|jgi:pseudaminic acid synthase|nr:pseudaminic acid synthase [Candidatus Pseudothioglobus singularis]
MSFTINNRFIGPKFPPYIIAELSANHNGSLDRALKTIDKAHKCGVDAIKIQTYTADTMTIDCDNPEFKIEGGLWNGYKLYDLYKWAETPYEWHEAIFEYAQNKGVTIFSSPFDNSAVDLLENLNTPAYKIASFEIVDLPLISYVSSTGKPLIISTGMANELEIEEAVTTARDSGCKDIALLHCISSYPAPLEQANLRQIKELSNRFKVISGLSDHTIGNIASIAAVAMGSSIIEKHFTLSRKDKGPDSDFSIEPKELERLCSDAKNTWAAIGDADFKIMPSERGNLKFRRSLYFVKDIKKGEIITKDHVRSIRPGYGISPKFLNQIIGKKPKHSILKGTPVKPLCKENYF